jgi:L-aminopeptidase/D-esterase-like protein
MRRRKAITHPRTLPGIRIGHASDFRGLTGCTVILCEAGAVCGVDIRGSAAGTREIAPCLPGHLVERVHAVFLTGGSAYGLDAAAGVMHYLEARRVGFAAGRNRIPIVPGAVIFDLDIGSPRARPTPRMALAACRAASTAVAEGSVGAGTGATVGKLYGLSRATKGGVGYQTLALSGGVEVHALVVVNAFGDVIEPTTGGVIAGSRASRRSTRFVGTAQRMFEGRIRKPFGATNTTLAVVMTNAALDKLQAGKVAEMAQDGLARAISPVHTLYDGDLVFALSVGRRPADLNTLGTAAAEAITRAIVRAIRAAHSLGGVSSRKELERLMA